MATGWKPRDGDDELPLPSETADGWKRTVENTPRDLVRGPKGDPGGQLVRVAASAFGVGCAVRSISGLNVGPASARSIDNLHRILGVSLTAATGANQNVTLVRTGEITNSAWSWVPFKPVFLDHDGGLTQQFDPSWVFMCVMGTALTPTTILVDVRTPVVLARPR